MRNGAQPTETSGMACQRMDKGARPCLTDTSVWSVRGGGTGHSLLKLIYGLSEGKEWGMVY